MNRSSVLPAVLLILACGCGESSPYVTRARMAVDDLDKAVSTYNAENSGRWPDSLKDLTQPRQGSKNGLVSDDALVDPWGRPYQYDPQNTNPTTGQPMIWSDGPNPGEPTSKIANWVAKE